MAAAVETLEFERPSSDISEAVIHAIMDLLSLPYAVRSDSGASAEASPFYLLHCHHDELRPRQARDAIFEILRNDPSLKEGEHYKTLRGYHPPLIGLNLESLGPEQRATLLKKLAAHADIATTTEYLGHRIKGDQKGALLPLDAMDSRLHFIRDVIDDALEAAQFRLNAAQIACITAELARCFDLSRRQEAIEKVLMTMTLCSTMSYTASLPARHSKTRALLKTVNQDAAQAATNLTGNSHAACIHAEAAFTDATAFIQTALQGLYGIPQAGTTAVGGILHQGSNKQRVLTHFNVGDSGLRVFTDLLSDDSAVFKTVEHTITQETDTTVQYITVGPATTPPYTVPAAVSAAWKNPALRAILKKCLLPVPVTDALQAGPLFYEVSGPDAGNIYCLSRPNSQGVFPINIQALNPEERRICFTDIFSVASYFHVYCAANPAATVAITPTRTIGDFQMGKMIGRSPTVGHCELPTDEDLWVVAVSDGVSDVLTEAHIKRHIKWALENHKDPALHLCQEAEKVWFRKYKDEFSDDITAVIHYVKAGAPLDAPIMLGVYDGHGSHGHTFSQWTKHAFSILVPVLITLKAEGCRLTLGECESLAKQLMAGATDAIQKKYLFGLLGKSFGPGSDPCPFLVAGAGRQARGLTCEAAYT